MLQILKNIVNNLQGGPPEYRALLRKVRQAGKSGDLTSVHAMREAVTPSHVSRFSHVYRKSDHTMTQVALMDLMLCVPAYIPKDLFYRHLGLAFVHDMQIPQLERILTLVEPNPNASIVMRISDEFRENIDNARDILAKQRGTLNTRTGPRAD